MLAWLLDPPVKTNGGEYDDLEQRLILYVKEESEFTQTIQARFCTEKCIYRRATLEDVFLRLTGRALRE